MNDWRKFNEIFRKDVTYDNIKSHKKQGFTLSPQPSLLGLNLISYRVLM